EKALKVPLEMMVQLALGQHAHKVHVEGHSGVDLVPHLYANSERFKHETGKKVITQEDLATYHRSLLYWNTERLNQKQFIFPHLLLPGKEVNTVNGTSGNNIDITSSQDLAVTHTDVKAKERNKTEVDGTYTNISAVMEGGMRSLITTNAHIKTDTERQYTPQG